VGEDTITVSVTDNDEATSTETITVNVTEVNDAPVIEVVSTSVVEDTATIVASASDIDGTIEASSLSAEHGTVSLDADGNITYTPDANYVGEDTITVSVTDNDEATTSQTISVVVNAVDDVSILVADSITTFEDNAVTGNVLSNDSDVDNVLIVTSFTIAGDDTTYTIKDNDDGTVDSVNVTDTITITNSDGTETTSTVTIGSISLDADGSYTFTPTEDWSGDVPQITYTTNTGTTSTLDITVEGVADAPTLSVTETVTINVDNYGEVSDGKISSGNGYSLTGYSNFVGFNSDENVIGTLTTVTGTSHDGIGVNAATTHGSDTISEIGANANQSEAIAVTFDNAVTSVEVSFAWLSSTETATYTLYSDGNLIYTGTFSDGTNNVDNAGTISFTDEGGNLVAFDTIVFSAEYDPSLTNSNDNDFLLNSLSFENVITSGTETLSTPEGGDVSFTINAASTDQDGSESLTVEVQDIPVGFTLTDGVNTFTSSEGSTVADVTSWNLDSLTLSTTDIEATTTYILTVVATATEDGTSSSTSEKITVIVESDNTVGTPDITFESTGDDNVYNAAEVAEGAADTITATISVTGSEIGDTLTYSVTEGGEVTEVTVILTADDIENGLSLEVLPGAVVTAMLSDDSGNESETVSATAFDSDTEVTSPTITLESADVNKDGIYNAAELGEDGTITATIALPEDFDADTDTLTINGETYTLSAAEIAAGEVTIAIDPEETITAQITDSAGNVSETASATALASDTSTSLTVELDAGSDTGISSTDNITSDKTPTFTGIAEAGAAVVISNAEGEILGSAVADDNGNYSITLDDELSKGTQDLTITATDTAGNTATATESITIYNVLLEESFENISTSSNTSVNGRWIVETGEVTGDHGVLWDTGDTGVEIQNGNANAITDSSDGSKHAELDTAGSSVEGETGDDAVISTVVDLNGSDTYVLSFDIQANDYNGDASGSDMQVNFGDVIVSIDSDSDGNLTYTTNDDSVVIKTVAVEGTNWTTVIIEYTNITADSVTLTFAGTGDDADGAGMLLDNILLIDDSSQYNNIEATDVIVGSTSIDVTADDINVTEDDLNDVTASGTVELSSVDAFTNIESSTATYGTVEVDEDGNWTYTLNNSSDVVQALADGELLTDTITFISSDGTEQTQEITITGSDDLSTIEVSATDTDVVEDGQLTVTGTVEVNDIDNNSETTLASSTATYGTVAVDEEGNWTYTLNNSSDVVQALAAGELLTDTITFISSDGTEQTQEITITGSDDPSTIAVTASNVSENDLDNGAVITTETYTVTDVDSDTFTVSLSEPEETLTSNGIEIIWSGVGTSTLIGTADGVEIIRIEAEDPIDGEGTYTTTLSGTLDHTGENDESISIEFGLVVSDGLETTTETLTVNIDDSAPTSTVTTASLQLASATIATFSISSIASGFSSSEFDEGGSKGVSNEENTDADEYDEVISWGNKKSNNQYDAAESSITASEVSAASDLGFGDSVVVASITHKNDSTTSSYNGNEVSDNLEETDFNVDVTLVIAGEEVTVKLLSSLIIDETDNSSSNTADSLTLVATSATVEVNGVTYTVYLDGFLVNGEVVTTVSTAEDVTTTYSVVAHVESSDTTSLDNNLLTGTLNIDAGADGLDFVVSNTTTDENGTLTINADGTYSFSPSDSLVASLTGIDSEVLEYTYTVVDTDGDSSENTLIITVNGTGATSNLVGIVTVESVTLVSNTDDSSGTDGYDYSTENDLSGKTLDSDDGFGDGDDSLTVSGSGTADIEGSTKIEMYDGNDTITVEDDIKGNTFIDTGAGDDTIVVGDAISENAEIDTGSGNDTVIIGGNFSSSNSLETDEGNDTVTVGGNVSGEIHMDSGDDYLSIGGTISDTVDGGSSGTDYLYLDAYSYDDYINDVDNIRTEYIEDFEYIMFSDGIVYSVEDNEITENEDVLSVFENGTANSSTTNVYTITGTATGGYISEGDTVTLEINGTTYTTTVTAEGTWSVDVEESDLDADNEFDVVVSSLDSNNNTIETRTSYVYTVSPDTGTDTDTGTDIDTGTGTDTSDDTQTKFEEMAANLNDNIAWFESNTGNEDGTAVYVDQNSKYLSDGETGSYIVGTSNNDIIYGNGGNDHIVGSNSQDYLYGGEDRDWLEGGDGDDKLYGNDGDDLLDGGSAQDYLWGGAGNDILIGGSGDDYLYGEEGDDIIIGGLGNDSLYGGEGSDWLVGGDGDDKLYGNDGDDLLSGGAGHDNLLGGAGTDILIGGSGNDTLYGEEGDDIIIGGLGNDSLYGGDGSDTFTWLADDTGTDTVYGFDVNNDHLDLSDLLQNETASNLSNYFDFDYSGGDTTIYIYADGDKGESGSEITQTIILDDVRLEGISSDGTIDETEVILSLYNSNYGSQNALIISDTVVDDLTSNSSFEDPII
jgi:VCBS repeat-containing protein